MEDRKSPYKTKQREIIQSILSDLSGEPVTIKRLMSEMEKRGEKTGLTTVYRLLDKLTEEGSVRKYNIEGSNSANFEYIGEQDDCGGYHFKCESCGLLMHFHCGELEGLQNHMMKDHGMNFNIVKTVFYGTCRECENKKREENAKNKTMHSNLNLGDLKNEKKTLTHVLSCSDVNCNCRVHKNRE